MPGFYYLVLVIDFETGVVTVEERYGHGNYDRPFDILTPYGRTGEFRLRDGHLSTEALESFREDTSLIRAKIVDSYSTEWDADDDR